MSVLAKAGLLLVGLGVIALVLATVKFKSKQDIFSVGGFRATTTSKRTFPELGYGGAGAVVVGCLLLFAGSRKSGGR